MSRRVYLDTLGCEKNLVDSQGALGLLARAGFEPTADPAAADLIVVNTCGFLSSARQESMDRIEELAADKGDAMLVAMGCLVQGGTHDLRARIPGLDHVLGVGQYHRLADLFRGEDDPPLGTPDEAPYAGYNVRALTGPTHVAHLKLAEGCNQSCAFCKIPALRGRQRSRPIPDLVAETEGLVAQGVRELILIAQNSSAYGIDLPGQPRLGDLCRALAQVDGVDWIRVMYAYPPMFTTRLADDVYSVDKVVDYLDIPIQHASPPILDRMRRGYDPDKLRRQIEHLRGLRPDIMLRTTALLGFPGETEEDVVRLLDFLAEVGFDHLGTFTYSHEEQTESFAWEDDVDAGEKEDRRARVEALQWDLAAERKRRWLGRTLDVVVDEILDDDDPRWEDLPVEDGDDPRPDWVEGPVAFGRTQGFCHGIDGGVWFPAGPTPVGGVTRVVASACGPFDILARPVGAAASTPAPLGAEE